MARTKEQQRQYYHDNNGREKARIWRISNPEKVAAAVTRKRLQNQSIRMEVIVQYGNKCECCGEEQYEFLCIDHIDGGGTNHRKEIGPGNNIYRWLRRNNFPDGYRVLCHNCNHSLGMYGYCPHSDAN